MGARCQVHAPVRKYLSVQGRCAGMAEKRRPVCRRGGAGVGGVADGMPRSSPRCRATGVPLCTEVTPGGASPAGICSRPGSGCGRGGRGRRSRQWNGSSAPHHKPGLGPHRRPHPGRLRRRPHPGLRDRRARPVRLLVSGPIRRPRPHHGRPPPLGRPGQPHGLRVPAQPACASQGVRRCGRP